MDHIEALSLATKIATGAGCAKSKRGVVIWSDEGVLAAGSNSPPTGFTCGGSCGPQCNKVAVHAEQRALMNCLKRGKRVVGAEMLHVKVTLQVKEVPDQGPGLTRVADIWVATPGGPPSCVDCSKLILESGIAGMWLYEDRPEGPSLVRYTAQEFHEATLTNLGLPL